MLTNRRLNVTLDARRSGARGRLRPLSPPSCRPTRHPAPGPPRRGGRAAQFDALLPPPPAPSCPSHPHPHLRRGGRAAQIGALLPLQGLAIGAGRAVRPGGADRRPPAPAPTPCTRRGLLTERHASPCLPSPSPPHRALLLPGQWLAGGGSTLPPALAQPPAPPACAQPSRSRPPVHPSAESREREEYRARSRLGAGPLSTACPCSSSVARRALTPAGIPAPPSLPPTHAAPAVEPHAFSPLGLYTAAPARTPFYRARHAAALAHGMPET